MGCKACSHLVAMPVAATHASHARHVCTGSWPHSRWSEGGGVGMLRGRTDRGGSGRRGGGRGGREAAFAPFGLRPPACDAAVAVASCSAIAASAAANASPAAASSAAAASAATDSRAASSSTAEHTSAASSAGSSIMGCEAARSACTASPRLWRRTTSFCTMPSKLVYLILSALCRLARALSTSRAWWSLRCVCACRSRSRPSSATSCLTKATSEGGASFAAMTPRPRRRRGGETARTHAHRRASSDLRGALDSL